MAFQPSTRSQVGKEGAGFNAVSAAYSAWARSQREESEGWCRVLKSSGEEMMRQVEKHEASAEKILREFNKNRSLSLNESKEVMFDVLTHHKQRVLDEWEEPDNMWTMQAELWVEACTICRIRKGIWAKHDWRECREHEEDVEAVRRAYDGVILYSELWTGKTQTGLNSQCPRCKCGRIYCWVSPDAQGCRFARVVVESVAAILGTNAWFVEEWEEQEGRGRGGLWGKRKVNGARYGFTEAGRVWRMFGWLGVLDITEVKVDEFKEAYHEKSRELRESRKEQSRREAYAVATKVGVRG
jgi:hypothetical protein